MESQLTYTQSQWDLVLASFVVALFALFAASVYQLSMKSEISSRYRPATIAGAVVTLVATLAYVVLALSWIVGFDFDSATKSFHASGAALQFRNGYRYVDWTVTVPLLCAELIGVSLLAGEKAKNLRATLMTLSVVMVVTGYLGEDILGRIAEPGQSLTGFFVWGLISTAAFIPLYFLLLREGLRSGKLLPHPAGAHIRNAALVLSLTWGVYPLAYLVPFFFPHSADWAVGRQIAFTLADIAAKVGYGVLIHAVAKARTAMDVAEGSSPHPEPIYINNEKMAEAQPVAPSARVYAEFGHPHARIEERANSGGAYEAPGEG